ncbi:MAG: hypothetical protein ACLFQU_13315 [Candidatus Kapaibacterium sp.]
MRTITLEIIKDEAINLLLDLERLKLIRLKKDNHEEKPVTDWTKYKGAMSKQPLEEIDHQLSELRSEWE